MKPSIPESKKLAPYLAFYIVGSSQIGVGVLSFQRGIAKIAGYDAWMSIIIAGIFVSIIVLLMYKMFEAAKGGFMAIHSFIFGKAISKIFGTIVITYLLMIAISSVRSYTEVVQVWMFERLSTFWFSLFFLLAVIYIVSGGIRTVTGMAFLSFFLPIMIFPISLFAIPYSNYSNLLPIFDHSFIDILMAGKTMALTIVGFEVMLFIIPFIKEPKTSKKWVIYSIYFTTIFYLLVALLTFGYFPENQLEKNVWPFLTVWKIIEFPFIERFEYIGIALWFAIVLPNVSVIIWCAGRLVKEMFSIQQKTITPFLCGAVLIGCLFLDSRIDIATFTAFTSEISFYFCFVYLPLLFLLTMIRKGVKKSGQKQ